MKKLLLISVLVLRAGWAWCADDEEEDKRPNGVRFGYQWANLVNDGKDAADNLDAFYFGFARQVKITPLFRFETGLEYMMNGAKQTENSKLQMGYLALPLQMKVKLGPFIGQAGLNANFKVYQKLTIAGNDVIINDDNRAAFFDLAANVGVGFQFLFLTAEARYYWGLLEVKNEWFNRYAQLGLKVSF
jgi:hypothetical protein